MIHRLASLTAAHGQCTCRLFICVVLSSSPPSTSLVAQEEYIGRMCCFSFPQLLQSVVSDEHIHDRSKAQALKGWRSPRAAVYEAPSALRIYGSCRVTARDMDWREQGLVSPSSSASSAPLDLPRCAAP